MINLLLKCYVSSEHAFRWREEAENELMFTYTIFSSWTILDVDTKLGVEGLLVWIALPMLCQT